MPIGVKLLAGSRVATAATTGLAVAAFAGNSLLARAALGSGLIGAGSFTTIRLAAGALMLLPWVLRRPYERPDWRGVSSLLVYCTAFSFAYVRLDAATGALLLFAAVQATILIFGYVSGSRASAADLAGVFVAMAGVAVLLSAHAGPEPSFAMLVMALAGVAWGIYSILGRSVADPARRTAGNFLLAALIAAPLPLLDGGTRITLVGIELAVASGAVASGLGYVVWYRVIPRLPRTTVGAAQLATPVVAAVAASLLLAEPLTLRFAIGALLVLTGVAATLRHRRS